MGQEEEYQKRITCLTKFRNTRLQKKLLSNFYIHSKMDTLAVTKEQQQHLQAIGAETSETIEDLKKKKQLEKQLEYAKMMKRKREILKGYGEYIVDDDDDND